MSYALHPYAVSIAALKKTLGSRDSALLAELHRKFGGQYAAIDELDEDVVSMKQALEDLVLGKPHDKDAGFKYGYALKFLCEQVGKPLSNEHWSSLDWDYIEDVDKALRARGVDAKLFGVSAHLASRGPPIAIPRIADFPSIGYLLAAEIAKALPEFTKLKQSPLDEEIAESLSAARAWLDHCARAHLDLVCFYH